MNDIRRNSVLIIDDEGLNITALTHILSHDYTIYAEKSGREGIAAAMKYLPDVILLDVVMPGMDGYSVITALKSLEAVQHIPVIFISTLGESCDEKKGLALGAADYISKPFSPVIVKFRVQNQIQMLERLHSCKASTEALEHSKKMLRMFYFSVTSLINSDAKNFEEALHQSMGMMAEAVKVDRMYIWKNYTKNGRLCCAQIYEHSIGVKPQQGKRFTQGMPYSDYIARWEKELSSGKSINNVIHDMPLGEQELLSPLGIVSILVVPIFIKGEFWGFVGFDDCHHKRVFTGEEESLLRSGSQSFINALLRNGI